MQLSPAAWHQRFLQQAQWTESLRRYLLTRLDLPSAARVLEAGCGTGVITAFLSGYANYSVVGLDLHLPFLQTAAAQDPHTRYCGGDALRLPFPDQTFDAVACHFFLLWVPQAERVLAEMARVTRPGGVVIAFAEPDYGGRIDHPPALVEVGRLQAQALQQQGADPNQGRQLSELFHRAGLRQVESGLLGGQWQGVPSAQEMDSEWTTLEADLRGLIPPTRLEELRRINTQAWLSGERVLFVPTFYAFGLKEGQNR